MSWRGGVKCDDAPRRELQHRQPCMTSALKLLKQPVSQRPRHDSPITMSKPTANWEKVGDKFYRKIQLYTAVFDQDLELENYNVVGAPFSGAVGRYAAAHDYHLRVADLGQLSFAMRRSCRAIVDLETPGPVLIFTAAPASAFAA